MGGHATCLPDTAIATLYVGRGRTQSVDDVSTPERATDEFDAIIDWGVATRSGPTHLNQDAAWHSPDGRLCVTADGGTRADQHAEIASAVCVQEAKALYRVDAGDELIARIVRSANVHLLKRAAAGERVGTTGISLVHVTARGRVLGASVRDSPIFHVRDGRVLRRVRPIRRYDFLIAPAECGDADALVASLPWWLRVLVDYRLPHTDVTFAPEPEELNVAAGDLLVVCTDGVSDSLDAHEIARIAASASPAHAATAIVNHAVDAGSHDDATCAVGLISRIGAGSQ